MLRKLISGLMGVVAGNSIVYGIFISVSNAVARIQPDGFPIDPVLPSFIWGTILAIVAVVIWPPEPRRNRYRDSYKSRLPVPLERVL